MEELDTGYTSSAVQRQDIRYWSDFNRLFYVPRTIQKVPDIPEWEDAEGNWAGGREMFTRYDEVSLPAISARRSLLMRHHRTQG
jgi:hypothetical protein